MISVTFACPIISFLLIGRSNVSINHIDWFVFNEAFGLIDFSDELCISDSCCVFIEAQLIIPKCNHSTSTPASTQ